MAVLCRIDTWHVRVESPRFQECLERTFLLTYAVISAMPRIPCQVVGSPAYLPPMASNTLLVPSRLAFLQRSTSGTVACGLANACALVYVAA